MPKLQDQVDADGDRGDLGTGARVAESKKLRGRREAANERLKAIREEARKAEEKEEGGKDRILRDKKEEVEKILDDMEVLDTAIDLEERLERSEMLAKQQDENGERKTEDFIERVGREHSDRMAQGLDIEIRRRVEHRNLVGEFTRKKDYRQAFWQAIMEPTKLTDEEARLLRRANELRAGGVGGDIAQAQTQEADAAGGLLCPEEWERGIHSYLQTYGGIMGTPYSRINVPHGRLMHFIFDRDIQVGGEILAPQKSANTNDYGLGTAVIPTNEVMDTINDLTNQSATGSLTIGSRQTRGAIGEHAGTTYGGFHVFEKAFKPYVFSTKGIEIANTLFEDEVYNFANMIRRKMTDRLFRMLSYIFTVRGLGPAYNQPRGLMRSSTTFPYKEDNFDRSGTNVARDGSSTATSRLLSQNENGITVTDLLNMVHSLDPNYRSRQSVGFMFTDGTLRKLRGLTVDPTEESRDIRFIWQQSLQAGVPSRILDYPYYISTEMDEFGSNTDIGYRQPELANRNLVDSGSSHNKGPGEFMFFGDFSEFVIRTVPGFRIRRLNELAAERDSVLFIGRGRWGSEVMVEHALKAMRTAGGS